MSEGDGRRRPAPLGRDPGRRRRGGAAAERNGRSRSRLAHNPVVLFLNLVMTMLVVGVIGVAAATWFGRQAYYEPGPTTSDEVIQIIRGTSVDAIADALEERGIISSGIVFRAASLALGTAPRIKAGEYRVPAGASMAAVMDQLVAGRVVQHPITIPEGLSSAQVVDILKASEVLVGTIETIPAEGTLLPETYLVERGTTRDTLIQRMQRAHAAAVEDAWQARQADLPIDDPRDLVILASIVEKETGQADERELVAGVFVNRLRRGMRLQSDPTILYGLYGGEAWERPRTIYRSEMDRPNPYNTYQIDGLPPGPIANPGRETLLAVADPAETDALYFVADGTGGHAFARTYDEHRRNVARWREIERSRSN